MGGDSSAAEEVRGDNGRCEGTAEDDGGAKRGETTATKEAWGATAATTKIARGGRRIIKS